MSAVDHIADALAEHRLMVTDRCRCGWEPDDDQFVEDDHRAHQADVIVALPQVAVIGLPEPRDYDGTTGWPVASNRDGAFVHVLENDGRIFSNGVSNPSRSIEQAKTHAAALLAAVKSVGDSE